MDPTGDIMVPITQQNDLLLRGFFWPTHPIKNAHEFVKNLLRDIDLGPVPFFTGNKYILEQSTICQHGFEAKALPPKDARVVSKFLKSLYANLRLLPSIISDA
ncbi:hypothetical protein Tco_0226486 [Tanacetum coccineum]